MKAGTSAAEHGSVGGGSSSNNNHGGLVEIRVGPNFPPNSWSVNKVVRNDEIDSKELKLSDHETLEKYSIVYRSKQQAKRTYSESIMNFLKMEPGGKRDRSKSFALGWKHIIGARGVEAGDAIALTVDDSSAAFQFELLRRAKESRREEVECLKFEAFRSTSSFHFASQRVSVDLIYTKSSAL
ncbi:hypothetical protein FNV43_RR21091 [Rhamnella rubrinervis]|uniref:TF-B3 domain-containing protein n=1 Tax=Rhamnella rubrinervis TaxID=2594499 RepID=A0A8K0E210_9ROSA|nr:hypothetical protein FNV43_RR21091 [Rhamnella rubrinervis]